MTERRDVAVLPLCAISAVVLALEVFESRLVAYSVQVVVLYAVIGTALLGFGAAGSLIALRRDWLSVERMPYALAWTALAFPTAIVVSHAVFVRLTPAMTQVGLVSLALSSLLTLPFLCAGTVITLALSGARRLDRAYAANLVGSGIGCFLPLTLLGPLDGEHFLGLLSLLAWLISLLYLRGLPVVGVPLRIATTGVFALALLSTVEAPAVFPVQPEPEPFGQLAWLYRVAGQYGITVRKRYDRWNPTGRIEIIELRHVPGGPEPYPAMFYAQDSNAGSVLFRWDGVTKQSASPATTEASTFVSRLCTETQYGQGYFAPRSRVLVIGLGGGPDVQCALYQQAQQVDVVEINPDSIAAIRGPFDRWLGGIGTNPRVRFHHRDGRSFVHRRQANYDLIQISGVDTKNLMAAGALALSENQLYTQEAFDDYLASLTPGGALSLLRFGEPEALRLANTAVRSLRKLGIQHPERHIALLHTGLMVGVIVRKTPWTRPEANAFSAQLHPANFRGAFVLYYSLIAVPLDSPAVIDYLPYVAKSGTDARFLKQVEQNTVDAFARTYDYDIEPATDDRPFFFDLWRYDRPESWRALHVLALRDLIVSMLVLSALLILLPLRKLKNRAPALVGAIAAFVFVCLGFGFILLEVWLFHRFSTFLGHQVYSLSVVLSTLLVSTGIGAVAGTRLIAKHYRRLLIGIGLVLIGVCVGGFVLSPVLQLTWGASLPIRAAIAMSFIAPLGLALGLPFVSGLSWLAEQFPENVPWLIGVNGFASVLGSVAVVPLSMATGYRGVLIASITFYVLAALASIALQRHRALR